MRNKTFIFIRLISFPFMHTAPFIIESKSDRNHISIHADVRI